MRVQFIILSFLAIALIGGGGKCSNQAKENKAAAEFMQKAREQMQLVEVDDAVMKVIYPLDTALFASMERTGCFGTCPIYQVNIYKSGVVVYRVTKFVDKMEPGWYKAIMAKDDMNKLSEKAFEIGLFDLNDQYPDASVQVADLPSTISYIETKGRTKRIHNGNYQHPQKLIVYEQYFDELLMGTLWQKIEPDLQD